MTDRQVQLHDFLAKAGWADAAQTPLAVDASTRSYQRLQRGAASALLMNAPPAAEGAACPSDASPEEREALGYNALARLAGPNLSAFTDISAVLRQAGLHAPEVYFADPATGFALIEDLGDNLYATYIRDRETEMDCYRTAIDALVHLHCADISPPASTAYTMLEYDQVALKAETGLLPDWYWPFRKKAVISDEAHPAYAEAWDQVLSRLPPPSVLILRDYHAENLLWLDQYEGLCRVGIIDFQDGLIGHLAYDLVSLLEDARRDVNAELATHLKAHYVARMQERCSDFDADGFATIYAILAAQRNAKILGIFARLINRDGKEKYRAFLPRVETHFMNDLGHPALQPVKKWVVEFFPELARA